MADEKTVTTTFENLKEKHYQVVVSLQKTTNVTDHAGNPKVRTWTETYLVKANTPEMAAEHVKETLLSDEYCYIHNPEYNESKFTDVDITGQQAMDAWFNGFYDATTGLGQWAESKKVGTTTLKALLDSYGPYVDRFDRTMDASSYTVGSGEKHPIPNQIVDGISIVQIKQSPIIGTMECKYDAVLDHPHHSNHTQQDGKDDPDPLHNSGTEATGDQGAIKKENDEHTAE